MKKFLSFLFAFCFVFLFSACAEKNPDETSETTAYYGNAPILGVQIVNDEEASFYALTKSGSYKWSVTDENGKTSEIVKDGTFCLENKNLCTFTRKQTGGSISLQFTGEVLSFSVYRAAKEEVQNDKTKILSDEYKISENSKTIVFPDDGSYYYVVSVTYTQGEVQYGFSLDG